MTTASPPASPPQTSHKRAVYVRSVSAMIAAVAIFSLMDSLLKLLSNHYPPMQVAALRGMSSFPLICAYVVWRRAVPSLFRVRWGYHVLRAVLGISMLALFSYALQTLPLAETYSLFFIAPLMITGLSAPMLGERVDAARWRAIIVGFLGMLVVLRPTGNGMLTLGGVAVLGTAACYAVSSITVRVIGRTDSSESMVFWLMFAMAFGAGALAAPHWVAIASGDWPLIAGLGVSGFIAQLLVTEAFKHGEVSAIAPFEYTALAWGIALDWLLWHSLPDMWMLCGSAIIVASGVYLIRHQAINIEAEHP
jgi:drug/metabolite transporter (DMT)-like permease